MDRTSVARRIQLGAVRILQTKIAEASDGIMAKLQYVFAYVRGGTQCVEQTTSPLPSSRSEKAGASGS